MGYDPFQRGPFPVGVETREVRDSSRGGRALTIELWYPARDIHRGADTQAETRDRFEVLPGFPTGWQDAVRAAAPADGAFPLVAFSHGFGTERRQSSFLCTHLASHGYVVCAPNHTGNTMPDIMAMYLKAATASATPDLLAGIDDVTRHRPHDLLFAVSSLDEFGDAGALADTTRLGLAGHSFGGWTALTATARHPAVRAVLALAPAGGHSSLIGKQLADKIELAWNRDVPTQLIVADRDSLLPLAGMHDLYERITADKRMFVLLDADHMHFCDRPRAAHEMFRMVPNLATLFNVPALPPFSELCSAEHALTAVRGLGLAHFDATLKDDEGAASFVRDHAMSELARRGIQVDRA